MTMTLLQAQTRYGTITNGLWPLESLHASLWEMPLAMAGELYHWLNTATALPVTHIYALTDMHAPLEAALTAVIDLKLASQLQSFDGCHNIRAIRGRPDTQSAHSWAGAIDINAATNALGTPGDISDDFAECFMLQGFTWGKRFKRSDPMHFSWLGF